MQHLSSHVATRKMVHSTLDKTPASRRTGPRKTAEKRSTGHYRRTLFAILGVLVLEDAGVLARVLCTIFRVALWLERCCIGRLLRPPHLRAQGTPKSAEIALFRPISALGPRFEPDRPRPEISDPQILRSPEVRMKSGSADLGQRGSQLDLFPGSRRAKTATTCFPRPPSPLVRI